MIPDVRLAGEVSPAFKISRIEKCHSKYCDEFYRVYLDGLPADRYIYLKTLDDLHDPQRFNAVVAEQLGGEPSEDDYKAFEARMESVYGNPQLRDMLADEYLDYFQHKLEMPAAEHQRLIEHARTVKPSVAPKHEPAYKAGSGEGNRHTFHNSELGRFIKVNPGLTRDQVSAKIEALLQHDDPPLPADEQRSE